MSNNDPPSRRDSDAGELAGVLRRNIHALATLRHGAERQRKWSERVADRLSTFLGSAKSIVLHGSVFGLWLLINSGVVKGIRPFDPFPFVMLAMVASIESIFISTFVLISQNRLSDLTDKRAELDVQISLLTEHEVTRLIVLCDAIAQRLGVSLPADSRIEELKKDVEPEQVMAQIARSSPTEPS
jgi:uncharacterized membrane protein